MPAVPAAAAFYTSFETGEPQPAVSMVEKDAAGDPRQQNVSGTSSSDGSLLGTVTSVTASAENAPGEVATNLADANPDTKWLAFAPAATVTYRLSAPAAVISYALTSAGDAPERDPKNFVLRGSTDGKTWTDLDTRSGNTFDDRYATNVFQVADPSEYSWYRLDITAVQSGGIVQLSDWDIVGEPTAGGGPAAPMVTAVGGGPISGVNIKPQTGWTGLKALRFSGGHTAAGRGYAWNRLFDVDIPVATDTQLSYKIFPDMYSGDLTYPSTFTAVDVHFTDGSLLSDLTPVDSHGIAATPSGQGIGKILYASQWNAVTVDLGPAAHGRTIDRILVGYDNPTAAASTRFGGWIDDLSVAAAPAPVDGSDLTNYVDVRRGTNSSGSFSRGNDLPISALPNGFTFLTPVTAANSQSWEYYYQSQNNAKNLPVLQGLAVSHEPSPWMGDRNQMSVMPSAATGVPTGNASRRGLAFDHATEIARPDRYQVDLAGGIRAETTPADHGGVLRFTFPENTATGHLVLDTVDNNGRFTVVPGDGGAPASVTGWVDNGSGLSAGRSRMFVYGTFDRPSTGAGTAPDGHTGTRYVSFDTSDGAPVVLKLATSFISLDQARKNHALELADRTFEQVRQAANDAWNSRLGVLRVEGANAADLLATYSNLYRLNLYPNSQFENTGTAVAPVYQYASPVAEKTGQPTETTSNAALTTGKIYVNNGFWDTYRTVWPAYTLLYPEVAAEIADGFVQQYRDGGWIARWSSPGYADLMTGTSSDVALADAYLKGVDLPDPMSTYAAALKNATTLSGRSAVGRKGLATSTFLGYTSTSTGESVSWGLEGLINDYGIGNMAAGLAKDDSLTAAQRARLSEESQYFLERATHYVNLFDPSTDFFRGRNADGSFPTDFDPEDWGGDFTETNGWNFAFHAPQDGNGLANLYGGRKALGDKLDEFFSTPETATKPGGYGGVIHEMLEARDVRMGMLGMSNQVSHHIPYMYNYAGQQYRTAEKVREIMQRLYVGSEIGQGYPGDEDNGEMSAWYLLSSLGIYPLQVGSPEWTIGSPSFTKATVKRTQGDLVINAPANNRSNIYVQTLSVNGTQQTKSSVTQQQLTGATTLDFAMGAEPSRFGSGAQDTPTSLTTGTKAPLPLQDASGADLGSATTTDVGSGAKTPTDVRALFDDDSSTAVTFAGKSPSVTWKMGSAGQRVTWYTVTSGPDPGDATGWTLQGSADGRTWATLDTRTAQTFDWRTQTRPFKIAKPAAVKYLKLAVTSISGAGTANLAELEFLTDGASPVKGRLRATGGAELETVAGQVVSGTMATVSGGTATKPADLAATISWGDGSAGAGTVVAGRLGTYTVRGSHTYTQPGHYTAVIKVSDRTTTVTTSSGVTVHHPSRPEYLSGFDTVCTAEVGTEVACDAGDAGVSRGALRRAGAVPGVRVPVPGTDLSFVMPTVPEGEPDNATGAGQTLAVTTAPGATLFSLIGTATQTNQDTMGTVTFSDGSTTPYPIRYGDWCGPAQFDSILALTTDSRLRGTGTDDCRVKLFATAPLAIPAGRTVQSVTLPTQTGNPKTVGRIHVFAMADNGSGLSATPGADTTIKPKQSRTFTLAVVTGGVAGDAGYRARVDWGDGTLTRDATVSAPDSRGRSTVTGRHAYAASGRATVTVLVSDGTSDTAVALTVGVGRAAVTTAAPEATAPGAGAAGEAMMVRGSGFRPGETVVVRLGTGPVSRSRIVSGQAAAAATTTAKADATGRVAVRVPVPTTAAEGLYAVTITGATSKSVATDTITVAEAPVARVYAPQAVLSSQAGPRGQLLRADANTFAPNEWVTVTFDGSTIGRVLANPDGVVTDLRLTVPTSATPGRHTVTFIGGSSGASTTQDYTVRKDGQK